MEFALPWRFLNGGSAMDARHLVDEFCNTCRALLVGAELFPEATYRIRKMADRVTPVVDRVYLKTLKGRETLLECIVKARRVGEHLNRDDDLLYRLLTDLEMTCEGLLKQAYEFRIKAG
jgi:hypothetical protein